MPWDRLKFILKRKNKIKFNGNLRVLDRIFRVLGTI